MSTKNTQRGKCKRRPRNSHTPGKEKGENCKRKPNCAVAISSNPYKGNGLTGQTRADYTRVWEHYRKLNSGRTS